MEDFSPLTSSVAFCNMASRETIQSRKDPLPAFSSMSHFTHTQKQSQIRTCKVHALLLCVGRVGDEQNWQFPVGSPWLIPIDLFMLLP